MENEQDRFLKDFEESYLKKIIDNANEAKESAKNFGVYEGKEIRKLTADYYELSHCYNELAFQYEVALNRKESNSDKEFSFVDHYLKLMAKHASLLTQHISIMLIEKGNKLHEMGRVYNMVRAEAVRKRVSQTK